jgi:hypothetical protein
MRSCRLVLSTKRELERETGLEPATFSLESQDALALWHRAQRPERSVSSYRVVDCAWYAHRRSGCHPRTQLWLVAGEELPEDLHVAVGFVNVGHVGTPLEDDPLGPADPVVDAPGDVLGNQAAGGGQWPGTISAT